MIKKILPLLCWVLMPCFIYFMLESPMCKLENPRECYRKAMSMNIANFSLSKIDQIAHNEFNQTRCSTIKPIARPKVIIIVPYRNRQIDLLAFLLYMPVYFRYQGVPMEILLIEQHGNRPFNRGKLFNAAIREIDRATNISKSNGIPDRLTGSTFLSIHDIDKLPISPNLRYGCQSNPHQLIRIRIHNNTSKRMYTKYFGGATVFTRDQLERMNGASNSFIGWGGEDDDLRKRVEFANMKIDISQLAISEFYEGDVEHERNVNVNYRKLLRRPGLENLMLLDGLRQVNYSFLARRDYKMFVWLLVDV